MENTENPSHRFYPVSGLSDNDGQNSLLNCEIPDVTNKLCYQMKNGMDWHL